MKRGLFQHAISYGIGTLFLKGLPILLLPVYAHLLPPDEFGLTTVAATLMALLAIVLPGGFNSALSYYYASARTHEARQRALGTIGLCMAATAVLMAIILELGQPLVQRALGAFPVQPHFRLVLATSLLTLVAVPAMTVLQVEARSALWTVASCANALLLQLGMILGVTLVGRDAASYLTGALAGAAVSAAGFALMSRVSTWRWDPAVARQAARYGGPLLVHGLLGFSALVADRLILVHFVPLSEIGVYGVAASLASLLSLAGFAFNTAWTPAVFRYDGDAGTGARLARDATIFAAGMGVVSIAIALFSREALALLSPTASAALPLMPLLLAGALATNLYYLPVSALFAARRTNAVLGCTISAAIVGLGLNALLIPRMGTLGAALAFAAANITLFGAAMVLAPRPFPVPVAGAALRRLATLFVPAAGLIAWLHVPLSATPLVVRAGLAIAFGGAVLASGAVPVPGLRRLVRRKARQGASGH